MPRTRRNRFTQDSFDVSRPGGGADSFAAAQVDLGRPEGRSYARSTIALSKNRHERSWKWLDRIGEVHYAIHRGAKVAGYTKLYCHRVGPDGTIGKRLTSGIGVDIVDGIRSPYGGLRGLVERFVLMMKVPGDTYLIRTRDPSGEPNGYDFLSASELDISGLGMAIPGDKERVVRTDDKRQIRRITLPNAENGPLGHVIKPEDFLGRVWRPSGQYVDAPDSPMRALDTECELLYTLTLGIKAKILNRLTLAGLMVLDKSVAKASSAAPTAEENQFHQNAVLNQIINAMTFAVTQPDDPTSAMPILLQTTGETAPKDAVALITTDRELWQTDMELRKELIDRIIMGLDVQPQHVRGVGDSSHWCKDSLTEIMTAEGWKRYDELAVGESVLTLNHETGLSEWNEVEAVNVFDVEDEEMLSLETRTHSSLSTMNHRWPVLQRTTEGMKTGLYRRWRTSRELTPTSHLIVAAPSAAQPQEQKWSDALVELIGWTWTEGNMSYRHGRRAPRVTIHQSHAANPENVARIRRALTDLYGPPTQGPLPSSRRGPKNDTPRWREIQRGDMTLFRVNSVIASHLDAICPHRMVGLWFVRELTPAQLELFINVSVMADGHRRPTTGQTTIGQKDPRMLDAVELAAVLAGRRVARYTRETEGFTRHVQHTLSIGSGSTCDFQHGGMSCTRYTGVVWCPTTKNRTWLARRNGKVFYTGNSAWAVSDDERRVSIQPDVEVMCWALTRLILNAELKARQYTGADRLCVWYDLTDANVKTNLAEDARQLDDRGRISAEATRRLSGIEEADAIPDIEYIRWVGVKESNPYLATYGLPEAENIDWEKVAQFSGKKNGPEADSNADPSETSPGKGAPDKPTESDTPKRLRPAG